MRRKLLFCIVIAVFLTDADAQFKINRASEDFGFSRPQTISFYTRSRYNRVEGFFLNLGIKYRPQQISDLLLYGDAGYGFKNQKRKRFRWNAGLEKKFFLPNQLTLGSSYFNRVESNDLWLISSVENTFAGIILREDFLDYFGRKGVDFFADYRFNQVHTLRLEAAGYRYETLQKNTNWAIFGGDKNFPINTRTASQVIEGDEKSIKLIGVFDWRDNPIFPIIGWYGDLQFEQTFDDFETSGLFATIKRYQPTYADQKFRAKLLFGSRTGSFAYQHLLPLGGLGNLRGYSEKEFIGNRLIYLTGEYIIGQEWLRHLPLNFIPIWDAISIGVFAETGYAWIADPDDVDASLFEFGDFELSDLRSDFGLSIYLHENLLRLDLARRTDRSDDNWRILFRILDKF